MPTRHPSFSKMSSSVMEQNDLGLAFSKTELYKEISLEMKATDLDLHAHGRAIHVELLT